MQLVPPTRGSTKTHVLITPIEPPINNVQREKRLSSNIGQANLKDKGDQREAYALRDELDMLQEENENAIDKVVTLSENCCTAETCRR